MQTFESPSTVNYGAPTAANQRGVERVPRRKTLERPRVSAVHALTTMVGEGRASSRKHLSQFRNGRAGTAACHGRGDQRRTGPSRALGASSRARGCPALPPPPDRDVRGQGGPAGCAAEG